MVLSEGAGIVVIEELEQALKRSANIYAEIIGYGSSYDASHITAPNGNGRSNGDGNCIERSEFAAK